MLQALAQIGDGLVQAGLTSGTNYKIRVTITIGDPGVETVCPWNIVSTLISPCLPPTMGDVTITPAL